MANIYDFSLFDIFPYYLVLAFMLVVYCGKLSKEIKARYCMGAMFILAAVRYGVAYDYYSYKDIILGNVDQLSVDRLEPLSRLLVEIGRNTHYQFFFAIGSFLTIFPIYKVCERYSLDPSLSLIVYYLHPSFFLDGMGIVRNAIAFSFVFYAFVLLLDNKTKKSILLLICAVLFHKSAVIGFLIFAIKYFNQSRKLYLLIYVASFLISALIAKIISIYADQIILISDVQRYIEGGADRSGGGVMTIIVNGICIFNFLIWNRLKKTTAQYKAYLCSYCLGACLWNVFLPADYIIAGRFFSFYALPLVLIIPLYIHSTKPKHIALVKRGIVSFFILFFTSHFYLSIRAYIDHPSRMSTVPYQTIFWYTDYRNLM